MKAFTEKLHNELLLKLDELDRNYDPQHLVDCRLSIITGTIDLIKEKLKMYRFPTEEDEIYYFKKVLPETLVLYIYYIDKIDWERITISNSPESDYKMGDKIFSQAENFREKHFSLIEYYRDEKTNLDSLYFLRTSPLNSETKYQLRRIVDPSSPPMHCELIARWIAYKRLENELKIQISENKIGTSTSYKPTIIWTLSKRTLIELIYALKEIGAFNNGKTDLSIIQEYFEKIFGISLGNISRSFQEILYRKKGQTLFLDQLKECLVKRIGEIEEANAKSYTR